MIDDAYFEFLHLQCVLLQPLTLLQVLEETPSPLLDDAHRNELAAAAVRLGAAAAYRSAGTVEFLVDEETKQFYFLEVNTRLQVSRKTLQV
jgi:acetyl/propionyl-CoA carboxylase alpha subunit